MNASFAIQTGKGNAFDPASGKINEIDILDVAHALSNICRYGGHCKKFYSVAEHSVLVYKIVREFYPDDLDSQWAALLHDATEAYVGDVPTPLKVQLPKYEDIEAALWLKIARQFKVRNTKTVSTRVKMGDIMALATEAPKLFRDVSHWAALRGVDPQTKLLSKSFPMAPGDAKKYFLSEYRKLKKLREKKNGK